MKFNCPLCHKAIAREMGKDFYKCDRTAGGCGKFFKAHKQGKILMAVRKDPLNPIGKRVYIKCMECGNTRSIKPQDKFQVKRCVQCQKMHRTKYIRERRHARAGYTKDSGSAN